MRILHIHQTVAQSAGGVVSAMLSLARGQASAGHQVEIFTTELNYPSGRLAISERVQRDDTGVVTRYSPAAFQGLAFSPSFGALLAKRARLFDVVHVHGLYRFPQAAAGWFARHSSVPYVVQTHGTLDEVVHAKSTRSLVAKRIYATLAGLPLLRKANAIVCTCEAEAARVGLFAPNTKRIIVPNCIDTAFYRQKKRPGAFRARYGLQGRPLVLFAGRLNFKKGLDVLIEAMRGVTVEIPNAALAITGPEPDGYGGDMRALARRFGLVHNIFFLGMLNSEVLRSAYKDADLFALPSYDENFGLVVGEAMASGCPVVVSDRVGIATNVLQAGAGVVTSPEPDAVAAAITGLLKDRVRQREMGRMGERLVAREYDTRVVVEKLHREYQALVAGPR